jgi:uncharacterized damage-inducible protein DinB
MTIKELFIHEWVYEMEKTRIMIDALPEQHYDYSPHAKSMTAGKLAAHIVEIPFWVPNVLEKDFIDFAEVSSVLPKSGLNTKLLLETFDRGAELAKMSLESIDDSVFDQNWELKFKGETFAASPKAMAHRDIVLNHLIHHRAQLTVYFRLLDLPVPDNFGPTADEGPALPYV